MIHGRRHPKLAGSASTSDIVQEAVMGLLKTKEALRHLLHLTSLTDCQGRGFCVQMNRLAFWW